jgi:hypothetical protein
VDISPSMRHELPRRGCATGQNAFLDGTGVKLDRAELQADPRSIDEQ